MGSSTGFRFSQLSLYSRFNVVFSPHFCTTMVEPDVSVARKWTPEEFRQLGGSLCQPCYIELSLVPFGVLSCVDMDPPCCWFVLVTLSLVWLLLVNS
ncbi:hypothetical protein EUGRSUZ_F01899 [Eucalyptus grandis]|uniref:Uncharacterized protein n=2 Tax=Eucalyptus grandis TaxID=71139 RepID=A0ACC3KI07_EUCGR|nr:hypothetical protein EUGRSUZ_F01899 [Eucalyptus grandis]